MEVLAAQITLFFMGMVELEGVGGVGDMVTVSGPGKKPVR